MCIFFFQAEDGIRDLVRSRGLGDVYKRQAEVIPQIAGGETGDLGEILIPDVVLGDGGGGSLAVSYTHLTLPTSDLV